MRILVVSDLHCEFHRDGGRSMVASLPEADVIVLAGDIVVARNISGPLKLFCAKWPHVVFVEGNHELYGGNPITVHKELSELVSTTPNFHWLNNSAVTIDGQRFIGGTLWFAAWPAMDRSWLNDFHVIKGFEPWVWQENAKTLTYLAAEVLPTDVVVTHHCPSWQSSHPKFAGSPFNRFFVCDVEPIIREHQPKLWIHGHTHESFDYKVGETRVVCNPFGYAAREENPAFNPDKIIDLGSPSIVGTGSGA